MTINTGFILRGKKYKPIMLDGIIRLSAKCPKCGSHMNEECWDLGRWVRIKCSKCDFIAEEGYDR